MLKRHLSDEFVVNRKYPNRMKIRQFTDTQLNPFSALKSTFDEHCNISTVNQSERLWLLFPCCIGHCLGSLPQKRFVN